MRQARAELPEWGADCARLGISPLLSSPRNQRRVSISLLNIVMPRLRRFLRIFPSVFLSMLGCVVIWLHSDSYKHIRQLGIRRPTYEFWLTSERHRIQLHFEHPGRSDESAEWLSIDDCRSSSGMPFQMTSIGFGDDDQIRHFEFTWAKATPAHMRPAKKYSFLFPHWQLAALFLTLALLPVFKACIRRTLRSR